MEVRHATQTTGMRSLVLTTLYSLWVYAHPAVDSLTSTKALKILVAGLLSTSDSSVTNNPTFDFSEMLAVNSTSRL